MFKEIKELTSIISEEIKTRRVWLFISYVVSCIIIIVGLVENIVNRYTIDEVFYKKNLEYLFEYALYYMIALFLLSIFFQMAQSYINISLFTKLDAAIKKKYYENVLGFSYDFILTLNSSELYYRMFHDITSICEYGLSLYLQMPTAILYFITTIIFLTAWSLKLTLYLLVIIIIQVLGIIILKKPTKIIMKYQMETEQSLVRKINIDYRDIVDIKLLLLEKFNIYNMNKKIDHYVLAVIKSKFLLRLFSAVGVIVNNIWSIIILVAGSIMVYKNELTVGQYIIFSNMSLRAITPLVEITKLCLRFEEVKINIKRYKEYIVNVEKKQGKEEFFFSENLMIKRLEYSYRNTNSKLLDLKNIKLCAGEIIGLVGANGTGKTTLIYILCRLIDAGESAEIYIDGKSIEKFSLNSFRKNVYVLTQSPLIFEGTLKDNLTLYDQNISKEKIFESEAYQLIEPVLKRCRDGLEERIDDLGNTLSVGEKQKISIARMILRRPKILLLDEPFTGLDIEAQNILKKLLVKYKNEYNALILVASHHGLQEDWLDGYIDLQKIT